jgi:isoquinoline 1-oxidoreductase beta subunit
MNWRWQPGRIRWPGAWPASSIRAPAPCCKGGGRSRLGQGLAQGEGLGLAVLHIWDTCLAAVAHVKVDAQRQIAVPQVTVAVDCGPAINRWA